MKRLFIAVFMLFSVLRKINFNVTLEIIDSNNKSYIFGNKNPYVKIKLT